MWSSVLSISEGLYIKKTQVKLYKDYPVLPVAEKKGILDLSSTPGYTITPSKQCSFIRWSGGKLIDNKATNNDKQSFIANKSIHIQHLKYKCLQLNGYYVL